MCAQVRIQVDVHKANIDPNLSQLKGMSHQ